MLRQLHFGCGATSTRLLEPVLHSDERVHSLNCMNFFGQFNYKGVTNKKGMIMRYQEKQEYDSTSQRLQVEKMAHSHRVHTNYCHIALTFLRANSGAAAAAVCKTIKVTRHIRRGHSQRYTEHRITLKLKKSVYFRQILHSTYLG